MTNVNHIILWKTEIGSSLHLQHLRCQRSTLPDSVEHVEKKKKKKKEKINKALDYHRHFNSDGLQVDCIDGYKSFEANRTVEHKAHT